MKLDAGDLARLAAIRTIDLTTFGRQTGRARRIEIWWFHVDDRFFVTGTPGPRDWLANMSNDPRVIVHAAGMDIDAHVSIVSDSDLRLEVFSQPETRWYSSQAELDQLVAEAPMVEVHLPVT